MKETIMSSTIYILLTLLVGLCLPLMASANGALSKSIGSPFTATFGIFALATGLIGIITLVTKSPGLTVQSISQTNWKMWLGAFIVVMNIVTFTVVPQKIGAANMIVFFITGQIVSSVVVEHFGLINFPIHQITWQRFLGICFLIIGVVMVKKF
jgi:bacterial/archaeal transporter family-2 protein